MKKGKRWVWAIDVVNKKSRGARSPFKKWVIVFKKPWELPVNKELSDNKVLTMNIPSSGTPGACDWGWWMLPKLTEDAWRLLLLGKVRQKDIEESIPLIMIHLQGLVSLSPLKYDFVIWSRTDWCRERMIICDELWCRFSLSLKSHY